jgi:hypothetical protein
MPQHALRNQLASLAQRNFQCMVYTYVHMTSRKDEEGGGVRRSTSGSATCMPTAGLLDPLQAPCSKSFTLALLLVLALH